MNGHFAAVGDAPTAQQYEHGVQVIDEEKQYKYANGFGFLDPASQETKTSQADY